MYIDVLDMPESPKFNRKKYKFFVAEDAAEFHVVGAVQATHPDVGSSILYSLDDVLKGGLFSLHSVTGVLSIATSSTGTLLDHETSQVFSLVAIASVSSGSARMVFKGHGCCRFNGWQGFNQGYLSEAACKSTCLASENCAAANMARPNADTGHFDCYHLSGDAAHSSFKQQCGTASLTEQCYRKELPPKMTDQVEIIVHVSDINEAPIAAENIKYYINEDRDKFSVSRWWTRYANPRLNGYDVDNGQAVTFAVVPGHGDAMFQTTAKGNRLYVKQGVRLDYETAKTHSIRILVSDPKGLTTTVSATVIVKDVNERPTLDNQRALLPENSARGTFVGAPMSASDPDTSVLSEPYYGDWTKLTSRGLTYGTSNVGQTSFDTTFSTSPTRILRRVCKTCGLEHKDIYYKRLTVIPPSISMYDLLHGTWSSSLNTNGIDFSLYSTYKDAVGNKNAWSFCNYNDNGIGKSTMGGVVSCRVVFFAVPVAHFTPCLIVFVCLWFRISKGLWPLKSD